MAAPGRWWRPPRLRSNEPGASERRASWLELFYDLVYVIVVGRLAEGLAHDPTPAGLVAFVALFVPTWWSWSGVTFYNDRFDTDDAAHRVLILLQMAGMALLALSVPHALAGPGFALSYALVRLLLVGMYVRAALHVPTARPLARWYAAGFSAAALLWAASALLPAPWRYALWALAMAVDVATPLSARSRQERLPVSTTHLPERIGLFTIIVLGEAVAATVRGSGEHGVTVAGVVAAMLVLVLAFCTWWVYFDNLDHRVVRRTRGSGHAWFYGHLPLAMGITAMAVGAERLVGLGAGRLPTMERWLLADGFGLALVSLAVLHLATVDLVGSPRGVRRARVRLASAGVVMAFAAFAGALPGLVFGALLALVGVAQVLLDPHPAPAPMAS